MKNAAVGFFLAGSMCVAGASAAQDAKPKTKTIEVPFSSHDGYQMFGKLTFPESGAGYPVVIYVQNAERMTVDMKRSSGRGGTFN